MALTTEHRRPATGARRFGYLVAVLLNGALLYAVNEWPGWDAVPFLTTETPLVVGVVNAAIVVNLAANAVYLVRDPRWLKGLGDAATAAVGLVATVRVWQVFPFDFTGSSFDWAVVVRILLLVGIVGCAIGVVAGLVAFGRGLGSRARERT